MSKNLRELHFKKAYDSDQDNLLNDFYIPALSVSVSYKRLAGFFSSGILAAAAWSVSEFIKNDGKMQLIIGLEVNEDDYRAINEATKNPESYASKLIMDQLDDLESLLREEKVEALGWMLANNLLQIKIGMSPRGGLFHLKVGILEDKEGNKLSFSGSDNETPTAWKYNIEEFKVFRNWIKEEEEYFLSDEEKFDRFWNHKSKRTIIVDLPEAVRKKIIRYVPKKKNELKIFQGNKEESEIIDLPQEEIKILPKEIKLRDYQNEAIESWIKNGYKGIFEMATGTGKTLAALGCLERIMAKEKNMLCIISAPYSHLLEQWKKEIKTIIKGRGDFFNNLSTLMEAEQIIIGSANPNWKKILSNKLLDLENGLINRLIIFTPHKSLAGKFLTNKVPNINVKKMIIADEVHAVGTEGGIKGLLEGYEIRLGLSATPRRWMDEEGSESIFNYFGDPVYEFSLEKAIKTVNPETGKTYLTPYNYIPYFSELTEEETERYIELTKKIRQISAYSKKNEAYQKRLDNLRIKRADILKLASNKLYVLREIIKEIQDKFGEIRHALIYCHRGEQLEKIQELLNNLGIKQREFTGKEGTRKEARFNDRSEREVILNEFADGYYQALVAMKCLDEGIDVPPAKIGVLVASSTNPREFIQRRGRILRRYEGKNKAFIYDIIILPPSTPDIEDDIEHQDKSIIKKEFARYEEFSQIADNSAECLIKLIDIEKKYNLYT